MIPAMGTGRRRVLLVEDETGIVEPVVAALEREGFAPVVAGTLEDARGAFDAEAPDIVLLDVNLPDGSGFDFCREVRRAGDVPVIMVTARGDEMDRIIGLEIGADDYLPKPFEPRELLARLRAVLRRVQAPAKADVLRFGRLEIDRGAREVRLAGEVQPLTSYQLALLLALAENAGRVMSRDALMDILKSHPLEAFDRSIDVHISRIRASIEDDAKRPRRVITVRGAGYVFAKAQD